MWGLFCVVFLVFSYSTVNADQDSGFTWSVEAESNIKFVEIEIERETVLAYAYNGVIRDGLSFCGRGVGEAKFESDFGNLGLNFSIGFKPVTVFFPWKVMFIAEILKQNTIFIL